MRRVTPYLLTSLALTAAGLAAHIAITTTPVVAVSLFFVPVVLISALAFGVGPALYAVACTLVIATFFFYPPIFSLAVLDPVQMVDLVIFTGVAAIVGPLAALARRSTRRMQQLYDVGRRLAAVAETAEIPQAIVQQIAHVTGLSSILLLAPKDGGGWALAAQSAESMPPAEDLAAAAATWEAEGRASRKILPGPWTLYAVRHGRQLLGGLALQGNSTAIEPVFLAALTELVATALERMRLAERSEIARIDAKADQLREAIISSMSHDLRTPLAAILGSSSTLERYGNLCSEDERAELAAAIREEAERLEHFIGRLFDLTRIRAGRLHPVIEPTDLADIVEPALRRCHSLLERHDLRVELAQHLPMVMVDEVLLQQALVNVLENAAKYAAPGSPILVGAFAAARYVELFVRDSGRGMTPEQSRQAFDHFYRATSRAEEPGGSGLGLTISRAFIEACGGSILADSPGLEQGTTMRIRLPIVEASGIVDEGGYRGVAE